MFDFRSNVFSFPNSYITVYSTCRVRALFTNLLVGSSNPAGAFITFTFPILFKIYFKDKYFEKKNENTQPVN